MSRRQGGVLRLRPPANLAPRLALRRYVFVRLCAIMRSEYNRQHSFLSCLGESRDK
jgi:hypothetical protein